MQGTLILNILVLIYILYIILHYCQSCAINSLVRVGGTIKRLQLVIKKGWGRLVGKLLGKGALAQKRLGNTDITNQSRGLYLQGYILVSQLSIILIPIDLGLKLSDLHRKCLFTFGIMD